MKQSRIPALFDIRKSMKQEEYMRKTNKRTFNRWLDSDRDGVINGLDCYPFNPKRHNVPAYTSDSFESTYEDIHKMEDNAADLSGQTRGKVSIDRSEPEYKEPKKQFLGGLRSYVKEKVGEQIGEIKRGINRSTDYALYDPEARAKARREDVNRVSSRAYSEGVPSATIKAINDNDVLTDKQKEYAIQKTLRNKLTAERQTAYNVAYKNYQRQRKMHPIPKVRKPVKISQRGVSSSHPLYGSYDPLQGDARYEEMPMMMKTKKAKPMHDFYITSKKSKFKVL